MAMASLAACADPFTTARNPPPQGTTGQLLYGLVCDRIGAQALPEDLTGASYEPICHFDANGNYASTVDQTQLPPLSPTAVDTDGNPVSLAVQTANRAYDVARIEALAGQRSNLISSFDTIFPATQVNIVNTGSADPTQSCAPNGTDTFTDQLTALLARFTPLYNDGTIPQSTESLARIFQAIQASPDAQQAFARFQARQGYRPIDLTLGVARPAIAYTSTSGPAPLPGVPAAGLRELTNAALALLSGDSQPYNTSKLDSNGNRLPIPGPANPQFNALIAAAHDELAYATQDPILPPLTTTTDPAVGRTILSRPWTDLELLEQLFYANDSAYQICGSPNYIALRDSRGYVQVALVNGAIPPPFEDTNNDGLADVDGNGNFITSDGSVPPSPFDAVGASPATRDGCGRALRTGSGGGSEDAGAGPTPGGQDAGAGEDGGCAAVSPCAGVPASALLYNYIDTSSVFATSLLQHTYPLVNPDPTARHETVMYALAGAPLLFGTRDGSATSSKCYDPDPLNPSNCDDPASLLNYNAFETASSPILDLVYALGQMLGDPTIDDTLAYVKALFTQQLGFMARLTSDALQMKANANAHLEAKIPATSTFWDEMLDVTVQLEQEPGLLEDVLTSLGADGSQNLGQIFANYMLFNDKISYDDSTDTVAGLNGPPLNVTTGVSGGNMVTPVDRTQPDTGFNRSAMQRFLSLVHDTDGVTACNKPGAIVIAQGIPLLGTVNVCSGGLCSLGSQPFQECAVFKIENLAKFYLDSIVGKATLNFRSDFLKSGILGIGAATVDLVEQSSQIGLNANDTYGFWDDTSAKTFRPRPQWLNRLVFFDQTTHTSSSDPLNITQQFLASLNGPDIGSSVCPERTIQDPCLSSPDCQDATDIDPGGMIPGLRTCQDGDWLPQRGPDTIFVWEQFGFYQSITPLLTAFINHGREDIFINLMETLYRHWADAQGTADECTLSADPTAQYQQCTKDGVVTYEPLIAQDFQGDILPALNALEPQLQATTIPHCTATNASGACTAEQSIDGISVLANATRALVDPNQALSIGLVDRHGNVTGLRNDGSTNPQVTPIYLLTEALNEMDAAFQTAPNPNPNEDRFAQWRLARSQLVDQFLAVDQGTSPAGPTWTFDNAGVPKFVPTLIDTLRAQIFAHCPTTTTPPYTRCAWARDTFTSELATVVHGPVFAGTMDILEALRTDPASRAQVELLLQYLLYQASQNEALPSMLATANDIIQVMKDDTNLVPLYQALAPALTPSTLDSQGQFIQKNAVDAALSLLGRISGRAYDGSGNEICSAELDPNQILAISLQNLVTPVPQSSGQPGQAPLQTIMDAIGDVNRGNPAQTGTYQAVDYGNIADNVSSFLLDPQSGLEQFYAIVKLGTVE
ncbi:MAG: hypothetical protein ACLQBL_03275 [Polyangiaceae bacterium]